MLITFILCLTEGIRWPKMVWPLLTGNLYANEPGSYMSLAIFWVHIEMYIFIDATPTQLDPDTDQTYTHRKQQLLPARTSPQNQESKSYW